MATLVPGQHASIGSFKLLCLWVEIHQQSRIRLSNPPKRLPKTCFTFSDPESRGHAGPWGVATSPSEGWGEKGREGEVCPTPPSIVHSYWSPGFLSCCAWRKRPPSPFAMLVLTSRDSPLWSLIPVPSFHPARWNFPSPHHMRLRPSLSPQAQSRRCREPVNQWKGIQGQGRKITGSPAPASQPQHPRRGRTPACWTCLATWRAATTCGIPGPASRRSPALTSVAHLSQQRRTQIQVTAAKAHLPTSVSG